MELKEVRETDKNELKFYEDIGNWDFSQIKYKIEKLTDWDFYKKIEEYSDNNSVCLDLGTGGGEKLLKSYPNVGFIIGTDFSSNMIETAKSNIKKYSRKNVRFVKMDNLNMTFPNNLFDIISARHTIIDAEGIYNCLSNTGVLIIEGVDKKDCWNLKELFGRGQAFNDEISISDKDYRDIENAGFKDIQRYEIIENEYYQTKEDLLALLLKTPILDNFSEINDNSGLNNRKGIEMNLLEKYIKENRTRNGILLKRVLYGIIAKK